MERRDSRSPDGAATLHVEFDRDGLIADASIAELDLRLAAHETDKLSTILDWLREPAPPASA